MFNIQDYLKKFSSFGLKDELTISAIKQAIVSHTQAQEPIHVTLRGGIAYVQTTPSLRTLLFMNKENIITTTNKNAPRKIKDIR